MVCTGGHQSGWLLGAWKGVAARPRQVSGRSFQVRQGQGSFFKQCYQIFEHPLHCTKCINTVPICLLHRTTFLMQQFRRFSRTSTMKILHQRILPRFCWAPCMFYVWECTGKLYQGLAKVSPLGISVCVCVCVCVFVFVFVWWMWK